MRSIRTPIPISLAVLFAFFLNTVGGQGQTLSGGPYKITSSVQASGGGMSTGAGSKVIEGTAGQSAAGGLHTGGSISHIPGFWQMTLAQSTTTGWPDHLSVQRE